MLLKLLPVISVFLLMILGCASTETIESTKVASTEIFQDYAIRATRNGTDVTVTFRVGGPTGSTIDLDAPARIVHNGKEMNESKPGILKGTTYTDHSDQFVAKHKFSYLDASQKTWENEISLEGLEITSENLTISQSADGTISLSRPVGDNEKTEFLLVSDKSEPSASNSNSDQNTPEKKYSVTLEVDLDNTRTIGRIKAGSLKNFEPGKANLTVIVSRNQSTRQSAKGGAMQFIYESQKIAVNVVD